MCLAFTEQIEKRRTEVNEELSEILSRFEASVESLGTHDALDVHSNGQIESLEKHDRGRNQIDDNDDNENTDDEDNQDDDVPMHEGKYL